MEYLLSLDAGTSSMRGGLYDNKGTIHFLHQVLYSVQASQDGKVEMNPVIFQNALIEIAAKIGDYCKENKLELAAVALTSQRSSLIPVDKNGKPLRNAIMWQDKRTVPICDKINQTFDTFKVCGMKATPVFTAPKILWLKQNEHEHYSNVHKFLGVHEYLLYHMTGKYVTDVSIASRSCLLDLRNKKWSPELLSLFEIKESKLSSLVEVGNICGMTTNSFSKLLKCPKPIPVISAGGDQQCAALGLAVTHSGMYSVNCGTGAYVVTLSDEPVFDKSRNVICNLAAVPGKWFLEASTMASGMVYGWFNSQFYKTRDYEKINIEVSASPPGANGIIMLPDLMGRGMPDWNSYARGLFYNIGFGAQRSDFARAVLESLVAELSTCIEMLRSLTTKINQIYCSGGLAKSRVFNQIQADTYGIPVVVKKNAEATMKGAWSSAAVTLGWYRNYDEALRIEEALLTKYEPNLQNYQIYQRYNKAREIIYRSLDMKILNGYLNK